jgi:hypothetical protein
LCLAEVRFRIPNIAGIDEELERLLSEHSEEMRLEVGRQLGENRIQDMEDRRVQSTKTKLNVSGKPTKRRAHQAFNIKSQNGITVKRSRGAARTRPRASNHHSLAQSGELDHTDLPQSDTLTDEDVIDARRAGRIDESKLPKLLFILDDVVSENSIRYSPILNKLAISGRHVNASVIILSQCVTGSASVPPIIRCNADFIMAVGMPRARQEKSLLAEAYLGLTVSKEDSNEGLRYLHAACSVKHRALVVDVLTTCVTQHRDFLYTYGPVPEPPHNVSDTFTLGTAEQWDKDLYKNRRKPKYTVKQADRSKKKDIRRIDGGRFSASLHKVNLNAGLGVQETFQSIFLT